MRHLIIIICLLFVYFSGYSQIRDTLKTADDIDFNDDLGLEELMNVKLTVASQKELSIDQTPAIVSVLTKEDIQRSASKDFTDVMRLIPGFEFAADVNSEVGIGVRGIYSTEGRVLVMIDGLQMNENLYGSTQWIGRFDINQIEKVEIIRGPGYAAYNGYAGLAVINIITKKAKDIQGIELNGTYSRLDNSLGRQKLSISSGWGNKNWGIKASITKSELYRAEGTFTDHEKSVVQNQNKTNYVSPTQFLMHANYKELVLKCFFEDYNTKTPYIIDSILKKPGESNFSTRQIDLSYLWKINNRIKITPRINSNYNRPYRSNEINVNDPSYFFWDQAIARLTGSLSSQIKLNEAIQLNLGTGYFFDRAEQINKSYPTSVNKSDSVLATYKDWFNYGELFIQKSSYTASLGLRQENHSAFGNVYLPRFSATKQYKKFNFKLAYSHAFRAPVTENLLINPTIKPEITIVSELQVSYKVSRFLQFSINGYNNELSNVIVYGVLDNLESYNNFKKLITRGFEVEALHQKGNWVIGGNYSYYQVIHNDVVKYQSMLDPKSLIAFSPHKTTFSSTYKAGKLLAISSSVIIIGKRYGFTEGIGSEQTETAFKPLGIWNLTFTVNKIIIEGLQARVGIFDVLNSNYLYINAYNNDKNPFRATGREFSLKLTYTFSKK